MLNPFTNRSLALAMGLVTLAACGNTETTNDTAIDAGDETSDASQQLDPFQNCRRSLLEADFEPSPLAGVGLVDGVLPPGEYLYSTTYLQLRQEPGAQARFEELMGPIMADLAQRPGLLAISLGLSSECGVARTLSVWRDDVAMLDFVTSSAHGAAVRSVGEVSRGGSLVTHWLGNESEATWQVAAQRAGAEQGPFY